MSMSMDGEFDLTEILAVFQAEAQENLAAMEDALLALEARPSDVELLHTVFRVVHTLKGDAANLGIASVTEFAHTLEDLLDQVRAGTREMDGDALSVLLESVDVLRVMVPSAAGGVDEMSGRARALLGRVAGMVAEEGDSAPESPRSGDVATDGVGTASTTAAAARSRTLRVDVEKLDRTLDLVGEIAIARGRLTRLLEEGRSATELLEAHREADRLYMDLQEIVMKLRMVPLGPTFRPFLRTVRDVAAAHGKLARLEIEGEDVEVDTSMVEQLRDPLTHMIRNAVDHGIEFAETRRAAGKEPCGTVRLQAAHEGGSIVIRVADDGAGLNRDRIVSRARQRGIVSDGERLGEAEAMRLIFEPGFSTTDAVTDLSGRGVGLDVVRRNVEALRGSIAVQSEPGLGATLSLRLPLTLAVIEGFSVGVGEETFVLPLDSVVECLELPAQRHDDMAQGVINLRGKPLPFLRLRDCLGAAPGSAGRENVVVVRHEDRSVGLVVDHLLGESQAVVKPLGRIFDGLPGIAGSTILGSGRVALILDIPSVVHRAVAAQHTSEAAAA